jgi:hypothetical protein
VVALDVIPLGVNVKALAKFFAAGMFQIDCFSYK